MTCMEIVAVTRSQCYDMRADLGSIEAQSGHLPEFWPYYTANGRLYF